VSWEQDQTEQAPAGPGTGQEAEVLRGVWSAQGQTVADLEDAFGEQKSCKRMADVGFDDFAGAGRDLRLAWRETLERDGKLKPEAGTVADLVLGRAQAE
jgi:hypothetical protein